jgi:glycosyltransferase involved in cell wall biosynthesis
MAAPIRRLKGSSDKMRIGIAIEDTWAFFKEVEEELSGHHQTTQFKPRRFNLPVFNERGNRYLLHRDLISFMRSNQVVFFEWASGLLETASSLPKQCGIVTRLHRYEMYKWADKINWDVVDRVILVTEAKGREFSRRFPSQAGKIVIIPEAISLDRFASDPQAEPKDFSGDLGILCNLSPRKRVYELILAFYELNCRREGFHLHIGGGPHPGFPDYPAALYSLVAELDLQNKITFHGNIADPREWYRQIDIFISNSYSEGLQVSPMEAIACGCYCLSHRWDGADEFYPETSLFFTDRELVERILAYSELTNADRMARIAGLQEIVRARHDIARTKIQIREVVEEVGDLYQDHARQRG